MPTAPSGLRFLFWLLAQFLLQLLLSFPPPTPPFVPPSTPPFVPPPTPPFVPPPTPPFVPRSAPPSVPPATPPFVPRSAPLSVPPAATRLLLVQEENLRNLTRFGLRPMPSYRASKNKTWMLKHVDDLRITLLSVAHSNSWKGKHILIRHEVCRSWQNSNEATMQSDWLDVVMFHRNMASKSTFDCYGKCWMPGSRK